MRAGLHFNLDDQDDRIAHLRATKSLELALTLWEIFHNTRRKMERREDIKDPQEMLDAVFEEIHDIMNANGIIIDDLIV